VGAAEAMPARAATEKMADFMMKEYGRVMITQRYSR
jgi:hypothetical protein